MRAISLLIAAGLVGVSGAPAVAAGPDGWLTSSQALTVNGVFPVQAAGNVSLTRLPSGKQSTIAPNDKRTGLVSVSTDGRSISFTRMATSDPMQPQDREAYIRTRLADGEVVTHRIDGISPSGRILFSADGKYGFAASTNGVNEFYRINTRTGKSKQVCAGCQNARAVDKFGNTASAAAVASPDGKYLAAITYAGYDPGLLDSGHAFVQVWKLGKKKPVAMARTQPDMSPSDVGPFSSSIVWTPNSKRVAFARFIAAEQGSPVGKNQIATVSTKGKIRATGLQVKADGTGNTSLDNPLLFEGRWYAFEANFKTNTMTMLGASSLKAKADSHQRVEGITSFNLSSVKPPKIPALSAK